MKRIKGTNIGVITSNKLYSTNKSGVKGVRYEESRKKWRAEIRVSNKAIFLGRFSTMDEAILARKQAEEKYFKKFINGGIDNE